jgi:hypothetical protein
MLFEYKPVVDLRPDAVNQGNIMEVLIQVFYCLSQRNVHSIVHCLTDLTAWHYFKFLRRDKCQGIEWSHTIADT